MSDELVDALFSAIEAGDVEAIAALWADDVEVWHNTDNVVQTKDENLATLRWLIEHTSSREYRDIVRHQTDDGFAQRHVVRLTLPSGRTTDIPAAIFIRVRNGKVSRVDEYLDSAHVAAAFDAAYR
jgi:ketosteroid isomerase-like protein